MRNLIGCSFSKLETCPGEPWTRNLKLCRRLREAFVCGIAFLLISALSTQAQVATGTPPFGSFTGGPDVINLANMNVHWGYPILAKAGRGLSLNYALSYDSSIWIPVSVNGVVTWQPVNGTQTTWGWQQQSSALTGYVTYSSSTTMDCGTAYYNWVYHDPGGTAHALGNFILYSSCAPSSANGVVPDGSGYSFYVDTTPQAYMYPAGGGSIYVPLQSQNGSGFVADANGNAITTSNNGSQTTFIDTLGSTALTIAGSAPNPVTYTYSGPNSTSPQVTVTYVTYNVRTTFCAPGIADAYFPNTALVDRITYADGTYYAFTYEPTPWPVSGCSSADPNAGDVTGRIAKVTLPTGGSISYSYFGGYSGILGDGRTAGFQRTLNDGTTSSVWSIWTNGSGGTTMVDPVGNETDLTFSGIYETKRAIYQGPASSGPLQESIINCYNSAAPAGPPYDWSPCINATVTPPITRKMTYSLLPAVGNPYFKWATVVNDYDSTFGRLTDNSEYDWTTGAVNPPVRQSFISYASLSNNIVNRPASVTMNPWRALGAFLLGAGIGALVTAISFLGQIKALRAHIEELRYGGSIQHDDAK